MSFKFLHTMIRVNNLEQSIVFYRDTMGMKLYRKNDYPDGRFTLAFLGYGEKEEDQGVVELTYNWDTSKYTLGNAFGHMAFSVENIYETCEKIKQNGGNITREPGKMKFGETVIAFIEDPNGYKIELIQKK